MDWLKDKKNQPIVIGVASLILIVALVFLYMNIFAGKSSDTTATDQTAMDPNAATTTAPQPGAPSTPSTDTGVTPGAAQPGAAPAANAPGTAVAKIGPMESWRADPFKPIGYKKPKKVRKPVPYIMDLPIPDLPRRHEREFAPVVTPEPVQPSRRMAGLLLNGRVYAIVETAGRTQVVQPGDRLNDGLATVERIERDKVVLRTTSRTNPRLITIRMTAGARAENAATAPTTTNGPAGYPGAPRTPVYPGMPASPGRI